MNHRQSTLVRRMRAIGPCILSQSPRSARWTLDTYQVLRVRVCLTARDVCELMRQGVLVKSGADVWWNQNRILA